MLIVASSVVVLSLALLMTFGRTAAVGVVVLAGMLFWLLVVAITIGHSASSLEIKKGSVTQLRFGRPGLDRPLSELVELEVKTAMYPGILRFSDGTEFHVSGIAVGKDDELVEFVQKHAPNSAIKRGD